MRPQPIRVPLTQGYGDELDKRIAPAGLLAECKNVHQTKAGLFVKRYGYDRFATDVDDFSFGYNGNDVTYGVLTLAVHGDQLIAITTSERGPDAPTPGEMVAWSWSDEQDSWGMVSKVPMASEITERWESQVVDDICVSCDAAEYDGYQMTVVGYDSGIVEVRLLDKSKDSVISMQRGASSVDGNVHAIAFGSKLVATYTVGTTAYLYWVDLSSPFSSWTLSTLATGTATVLDMATDGTNLYVTDGTKAWSLDSSLAVAAGPLTLTHAGTAKMYGIGMTDDESQVLVATINSTVVYLERITAATMASAAVITCYSGGNPAGPLSIIEYSVDGYAAVIWSEYVFDPGPGTVGVPTISFAKVDLGAGTVSAVLRCAGAHQASKPFACSLNSESWWQWLVYDRPGSYQRQYILARYYYGWSAAGSAAVGYAGVVPESIGSVAGETRFLAPAVYEGNVAFAADYAIGGLVIDVALDDNLKMQGAGEHFGGSRPCQFDGERFVEHGFMFAPDQIAYSDSGTSGVPAGDYQYVAIYKWTDRHGNVHRSAPSLPVSVSLLSAKNVTLYVETLPFSWRHDYALNESLLSVEVYRTTDGGTLFHHLGDAQNVWVSQMDSGSGYPIGVNTFVDTATDASILANPTLYTDSGELEEFSPPVGNAIARHGGRIWVAGGKRAYYSKTLLQGYAPGFSPTSYVEFNEEVTALASLGGSLVAFHEHGSWVIWGDGPDRLGVGQFNRPQETASEMGCPNALGGQRSVLSTDVGVVFRSHRGIAVMTDSGSAQVISHPIEDLLATYPIVTSATHVEDDQKVKFTLCASESRTSAGRVVVWDYRHNIWSYEDVPGTGLAGGVIWEGAYGFCFAAGLSVQGHTYLDHAETYYLSRIRTKPLYPAGPDGEARCYSTSVEGDGGTATTTLTVDTNVNEGGWGVRPRDFSCSPVVNILKHYENPVQRCNSIAYEFSDPNGGNAWVKMAGFTIHAAPMGRKRLGSGGRA